MKERPILFQGAMVRALLDGSKTQTRRIVKHGGRFPSEQTLAFALARGCPYGQTGDQLWVRETFQPLYAEGWENGVGDRVPDFETGEGYKVGYPATDGAVEWIDGDDNIASRSKPSIHMPRWASRIQLEIVSVRVEQLNDCSEGDAISEGVLGLRNQAWDRKHFPVWRYQFEEAVAAGVKPPIGPSPAQAYEALWDSINGAGSWAANPWVWVVEFRRFP